MRAHAEIKELLAIYDRLLPEELAEVNAHIAMCVECADELAAWRRMDRGLRYLPDPAPSPALREKLPLPQPVSLAQAAAEPRLTLQRLPPAPPPPPVAPRPEPAPRAPFPWQRLLLPAGLLLLFVVSIWLGLRDTGRGPSNRVATPDVPARIGETPQPSTTAEPAGATIIFACDDVTAVYKDYATLARAFEQENPDVKVVVKSFRDLIGNPSLSYTQYMQEVAANADAFCVWDVAPLVQAHLLYNLDAFVARDASFDVGDFYEAVLNTVRDNGALYAIPSRFQPALIRYDAEAFDKAGVARPRPGWTWDDFVAATIAVTEREDGNTRRWGLADDAGLIFNARFAAALNDPVFLSAASTDDPFLSSRVVDLFRWYERLYVTARAAAPPRFLESADAYVPAYVDPRDVSRGKMAMWTDLMYQNARRQGKPAPFPSDGQNGAPVYPGPAWAIAAETLHPDAAWRWLHFLSRNPPPDNAQLRLPTRRSLVEGSAFWKELPADEAEVYRYILDHLMPRRNSPDAANTLYRTLRSMVLNQTTLAGLLVSRTATPASPNAVPTNKPVLTFAASRDTADYYRNAAVDFMMAHRDVNVQVIVRESLSDPTRAEDTTIWQQMRQVANRADVIAGPGVAALARSGRAEGILLDLTARIAALPPGRGFYSNTVESLAWGGRVWAAPDRVFVYMIAFNSGIFDQMGAAYPQPGWTWEEFARAAQAATLPSADKMKWWGFSDGAGGTLPLLLAATGPLVDYSADAPRALLDQPRVIAPARWYADLWRQGFITVPDARETARDLAAPHRAAMWVELADPAALDSMRESGVGVAPFPVAATTDATTPIEIENAFAISADTDRPDDAWKLIEFLLSYRGEDAPAGVSAQPGAALAIPWRDQSAQAAYDYALNHAQRAAPLRREEYIAREALVDAVTRLAIGESDAERVMRDAQAAASARMGQ